jgi:hypothetical protein
MFGRIAAAVAAITVLASCAASESVERAPPPPSPVVTEAAPPPSAQANVAAPFVLAQADAQPAPSGDDDDIVVPGQTERQVPAPAGDPRTAIERMEDIRAWDQCVMQAQSAGESDPMRPQLDQPEDMCARQLGMANRTAVPNARRR